MFKCHECTKEVNHPWDYVDHVKEHYHSRDRRGKLELLKQYYLEELVEDPIDGTPFDMKVLDMIEDLKKEI